MKKNTLLLTLLLFSFVSFNSFTSKTIIDQKFTSIWATTTKTQNFTFSGGFHTNGVITLKYDPTGIYFAPTAVITGFATMQMTNLSHSGGSINIDSWKGDYVDTDGTEYIVTFVISGNTGNWQISNVSTQYIP